MPRRTHTFSQTRHLILQERPLPGRAPTSFTSSNSWPTTRWDSSKCPRPLVPHFTKGSGSRMTSSSSSRKRRKIIRLSLSRTSSTSRRPGPRMPSSPCPRLLHLHLYSHLLNSSLISSSSRPRWEWRPSPWATNSSKCSRCRTRSPRSRAILRSRLLRHRPQRSRAHRCNPIRPSYHHNSSSSSHSKQPSNRPNTPSCPSQLSCTLWRSTIR